jgi:hypothetical protein
MYIQITYNYEIILIGKLNEISALLGRRKIIAKIFIRKCIRGLHRKFS